MNYKLILSVFVLTLFGVFACSEADKDVTVNVSQGIHGEGAKDKNSPNFHGYYLTNIEDGSLDNCKQCHGSDFGGGITDQRCTDCHKPIAIHQDGIKNPGSPNFHAAFMSENSHTMEQCSQCHGDDYEGGVSSPTCANCHKGIPVHEEGVKHRDFIKTIGWDIAQCKQCHGSDYNGGLVSPSCNTCHGSSGPESCNTCHGDFYGEYTDTLRVAPPQDLWDNTETSAYGVGSHLSHTYDNNFSDQPDGCFSCHKNKFSGDVLSHIVNGGKADIVFDDFSTSDALGSPTSYNSISYTCQNTYCHGNFSFGDGDDKIVGNNKTVTFNKVDDSQAYCGSCHGQEIDGELTPLPVNHSGTYSRTSCYFCHGSVVNSDGEIIDKTKHINGEKDF